MATITRVKKQIIQIYVNKISIEREKNKNIVSAQRFPQLTNHHPFRLDKEKLLNIYKFNHGH